MPNEVFFDLLGLPESGPDRARLERWVHELKDRKPDDARLTPVAKAATAGIQSYFVDLLNERRRNPRAGPGDAPGQRRDRRRAVRGRAHPRRLGDHGPDAGAVPRRRGEHRGLVGTLFKLLAENPDQREILRANPELIPDAVEEAIRIATPLQLVGRTTSREVTLHGVTIPAGGRVVLVYGAANRDERRFADPDRFDVTRGKQRHLGFGEGMHGCIGAPLARLEAKIALEEALPLMGDYTITDAARALPHHAEHVRVGAPAPGVPGHRDAAHRDPRGHVETAQPPHRHHRGHPRAGDRGPGRGQGRAGRRRRRADAADARRRAAARSGRRARTSTSSSAAGCPTGSTPCAATWPTAAPTASASCATPSGGGGSRHVHDRLAAGDVVRVRGPRNNFALVALAALPVHRGRHRHHADPADDRRGRGGGRRVAARLRRPHPGVDGVPRRAGGVRRPRDREPPGRDGPARPRDPARHPGARHARLLLRAGAAARRRRGRGARRGRRPRCTWSGSPPGRWARPCAPRRSTSSWPRSGLTLTVPPERSILDVVEAAGVGVLSSCAEGTCGTCETTVLDGRPDHRDSVLTRGRAGRERAAC